MLLFRVSLTWRRHVWNVRWLLQNARHVVERKWSSVRGCSAGGILRWLLPVWMLDREISADSAAATTVDPSRIVLYVPVPAFGNQLQHTNIYYCAPLGQVISMQHVNLDNTFYDWLENVIALLEFHRKHSTLINRAGSCRQEIVEQSCHGASQQIVQTLLTPV